MSTRASGRGKLRQAHRVRQLHRRISIVLCLAAAACACFDGLLAQPLYRYRDTDGSWVYSDRQPAARAAEVEEYSYTPGFARPEVSIERRSSAAGIVVFARNTWHSHVQIAWQISSVDNVVSLDTAALSDNAILEPRSETQLLRLAPLVAGEAMRFAIEYQHIPGKPGAEHSPPQPYRLPFASARSFRVSQAWPTTMTHTDPASAHAFDFVMPVGTGVYAARGGIVIEIADEYYAAGLDPDTDLARANIVRILHEDGTMALYAHLNWNSIRVRPGQAVERGEYLADSGNTGFSTGPHLHFVVHRNAGGAIESVPIEFTGPGNAAVRLQTGDRATAY